jgi:phosphatidate cytidylyltransferase
VAKDETKRDEDLFEGLDNFFAPIEADDWPDEAGEEAGALPSDEEIEALEEWSPDIVVPDADELLTEEPAAPEVPASGEAAAGEITQELSDEEWDQLQSALSDDEAPAPRRGRRRKRAEPEISVEDLKAPPPVYADLPGPVAGADQEEAPDQEPTDEGVRVFGDDEPEVEEPAVSVREPAMAEDEVEAAAEHFATGLREAPDEVERELLSDLEGAEAPTVRIAGEEERAVTGPTWEDSALGAVIRQEEQATAAPPAEGRNLVAAFVSGIILAALLLSLIVIGKGPFAILAGAVIILGQGELYAVLTRHGYQPATALGLVLGGLMVAAAYLKGEAAMLFIGALGSALSLVWFMAASPKARRGAVVNAGATVLGLFYVPFLAGYALLLLAIPGTLGRDVLLVVIALTVLYDVSAYAIGSLWGSRPLAQTISPNKSWEGAIGASFILLLVGLAVVPSIDPFEASSAVGLSLVISVFAPLGDLAESLVKRDLGVKDMSGILPGHGGILDRIDSLIFALPASFYFLRIVF